MYIVDGTGHRIRLITVSTGIITTIVGTGTAGYSGDGGAATSAKLNYPFGIFLDSSGNMYIGDMSNHRIRKVTISTGVITTIAGNGASSYTSDGGSATSVALYNPKTVAIDSSGIMYIADMSNNRIRKVTYGATSGPSSAPTYMPSYTPSYKPTYLPRYNYYYIYYLRNYTLTLTACSLV